jgi:hypothetical protein
MRAVTVGGDRRPAWSLTTLIQREAQVLTRNQRLSERRVVVLVELRGEHEDERRILLTACTFEAACEKDRRIGVSLQGGWASPFSSSSRAAGSPPGSVAWWLPAQASG